MFLEAQYLVFPLTISSQEYLLNALTTRSILKVVRIGAFSQRDDDTIAGRVSLSSSRLVSQAGIGPKTQRLSSWLGDKSAGWVSVEMRRGSVKENVKESFFPPVRLFKGQDLQHTRWM